MRDSSADAPNEYELGLADERLAELERQAAEQPFAMSEDVRELVAEVRRGRAALDVVDLNMQETLKELRLRTDSRIAKLESEVRALRFVLAERERELLEIKGPCSTCSLHYAHAGPCGKEAPSG